MVGSVTVNDHLIRSFNIFENRNPHVKLSMPFWCMTVPFACLFCTAMYFSARAVVVSSKTVADGDRLCA